MTRLPKELAELVDAVLARADLDPAAEREARADLEQHLADGLAHGRSVDELAVTFGDPEVTGPLLSRSPAPGAPRLTGARGALLDSIVSDVRHALASLRRTPSLAVTATVVLALGIGANAVVFTLLNELFLRPLPFEEPETLVDIWADIPGGNSFLGVSYPDYRAYRDDADALTSVAAFTGRRLVMGERTDPVDIIGQFVTPEYFGVLGIRPVVGSGLPESESFGDPPVAVLSHGLWVSSFGADPSLVGTTIRVEDLPVTVVGVGPPGFFGHFLGFRSDLWLPMSAAVLLIDEFDPDDPTQKSLEMIGRRRPEVGIADTRRSLNLVAEDLERRFPEHNRGHRVGATATTGLDHSLHAGVAAFVSILTAVSILVLLVACLNVGSVLLVRAMARDRELATRVALGAGRGRLLRQLLTETAVLVLLGATVGVLLAARLNGALAEALPVISRGLRLDLTLDRRVLGLTALVALAASTVASLAPALHTLGKAPASVLRSRGGDDPVGLRLRSGLVMGQVAISVVLVIATVLFVRSLVEGGRIDPGFDADEVATFTLPRVPAPVGMPSADPTREVLDRIAGLPTVRAVAYGDGPQIGVTRTPTPIDVPGVPPPPDADAHIVDSRRVGPGYLSTLGIPLLTGRDFRVEDDRDGPPVAVVSSAFRERFLPGSPAVGRFLLIDGEPTEVIGVAADTRYLVQDDTPDPFVYRSRPLDSSGAVLVSLRAPMTSELVSQLEVAVAPSDPAGARLRISTGREVLDGALLPQRVGSIVVGAMGFVALLLAAVGLHGLVQLTVSRSAHELAVRLALGGGPRSLLSVVLRKGFLVVAGGIAFGVVLALVASTRLVGFLNGVSATDPVTYLGVVACFSLVAGVASWLPARRALRIEPVEALRGE